MQPSARRLLTLLAGVLTLTSCGDDDPPTGVGAPGPVGRVRVVNAVPAATATGPTAVNVIVAGTPFVVNLAYGAAAPVSPTVYYAVLAGTRDLAVRRTADTSVHVLDLPLNVAANTEYTVLAVGPAAAAEGVVLTDDNSAPATGQVKVRAVNASPSAPSVDVYVTSATADIAALSPTASAVAFKAATPYVEMPAGTVRVRFTTAGTKTVLRDVSLASLAAGAIRTVVLLDASTGGTPLTSLTLTDR